MKSLKKLTALLLSAALIIGLVACGSPAGSVEPGGGPDGGGGEQQSSNPFEVFLLKPDGYEAFAYYAGCNCFALHLASGDLQPYSDDGIPFLDYPFDGEISSEYYDALMFRRSYALEVSVVCEGENIYTGKAEYTYDHNTDVEYGSLSSITFPEDGKWIRENYIFLKNLAPDKDYTVTCSLKLADGENGRVAPPVSKTVRVDRTYMPDLNLRLWSGLDSMSATKYTTPNFSFSAETEGDADSAVVVESLKSFIVTVKRPDNSIMKEFALDALGLRDFSVRVSPDEECDSFLASIKWTNDFDVESKERTYKVEPGGNWKSRITDITEEQ